MPMPVSFARLYTGVSKCAARRKQRCVPQHLGVVLHPAVARKDLIEFALRAAEHAAARIEHQRTRARRALINRQYAVHSRSSAPKRKPQYLVVGNAAIGAKKPCESRAEIVHRTCTGPTQLIHSFASCIAPSHRIILYPPRRPTQHVGVCPDHRPLRESAKESVKPPGNAGSRGRSARRNPENRRH